MILKFIFLFPLSLVCSQTVDTKFGKIKGESTRIRDGTVLYVFSGIPYAAKPVSELRFKDPREFTGTYPNNYLKATKPTKCVHYSVKKDKVSGQEDCLHLNIYTTSLDSNSNYGVIFYIHGGEFVHGAGYNQSPELLFDFNKKIVFVSINYRLGPFGFLSTDNDVVPGNMGLKDQVVALKWVRDNIKVFGGNPHNVLLMGSSSGGACVHLHYLSPMSRGLFSKGISFGGAALSRFGLKDKYTKDGFKALVQLFPNCRKENDAKSVECLTNVPATEIMDQLLKQDMPIPKDKKILNDFRPVVEKGGSHPFLNKHPYFLFKEHKVANVPWILGVTSGEGLVPAAEYLLDQSKAEHLNNNWNTMAPILLEYIQYAPQKQSDLDKISQLVRGHYFGKDPIYNNKDKLIQLFGDRLHYVPLENSLRLHAAASNANTYMYMFDYRGSQSFTEVLYGTHEYLGVCHLDDTIYLLKMHNFQKLDKDEIIHRRMMNMWDSFLQNGVPDLGNGVKWPSVQKKAASSGKIGYILLDGETREMSNPNFSERSFWDSLPIDELHLSGSPRIPTYISGQTESKKSLLSLPFTSLTGSKKGLT